MHVKVASAVVLHLHANNSKSGGEKRESDIAIANCLLLFANLPFCCQLLPIKLTNAIKVELKRFNEVIEKGEWASQ